MRNRVPHRIVKFYRHCVANRLLRSILVMTRSELSETGSFLAFKELWAGSLSLPAAFARLASAPRAAASILAESDISRTMSQAASATRDSNLEISSSTSSIASWCSIWWKKTGSSSTTSALYEHIPSIQRFKSPLRVTVSSASCNIVYNKIINFEIPNVARWLLIASDHKSYPPNKVSRLTNGVAQSGQLFLGKLIVPDVDKLLKELCFVNDNGHLFEITCNCNVRYALRHLIPACKQKAHSSANAITASADYCCYPKGKTLSE